MWMPLSKATVHALRAYTLDLRKVRPPCRSASWPNTHLACDTVRAWLLDHCSTKRRIVVCQSRASGDGVFLKYFSSKISHLRGIGRTHAIRRASRPCPEA